MLLVKTSFMKIREIVKLLDILTMIGKAPSDRCSISRYYVFVGGNLIMWKGKTQNVVARSSAKMQYGTMSLVTCEIIWLNKLLKEFKFEEISQMYLVCHNHKHYTSILILSFMRRPNILR